MNVMPGHAFAGLVVDSNNLIINFDSGCVREAKFDDFGHVRIGFLVCGIAHLHATRKTAAEIYGMKW